MSDGPLPWRTLSSRIVVSDRWLTLRADTCETADGVRIDPFYVVDSVDVIVAIALTEDRQLVLVRQYRHGYGATTLELPAGRIDIGEDPVAACRRELVEETGYSGTEARLLHSLSLDPLRYGNRVHIILIEGVSKIREPTDDPAERLETRLWPFAQATRLFLEREFVHAGQAGALAIGLAILEDETREE